MKATEIFQSRSLILHTFYINDLCHLYLHQIKIYRVNTDILGISKLKWTGMGELNSNDH